jgi:tRNA G26 N,N-dimethylase Trm1
MAGGWPREGAARLEHTAGIFYNPKQLLQRDLSLLVVRAFAAREAVRCSPQGSTGMVMLDALCGTGVRAVRYALEAADAVALVLANDVSADAASAARRNARASGVPAGHLESVGEAAAELGRGRPVPTAACTSARLLTVCADACGLMEQLRGR